MNKIKAKITKMSVNVKHSFHKKFFQTSETEWREIARH